MTNGSILRPRHLLLLFMLSFPAAHLTIPQFEEISPYKQYFMKGAEVGAHDSYALVHLQTNITTLAEGVDLAENILEALYNPRGSTFLYSAT